MTTPDPQEALRDAVRLFLARYDRTGIVHDVSYESVNDAVPPLRAALAQAAPPPEKYPETTEYDPEAEWYAKGWNAAKADARETGLDVESDDDRHVLSNGVVIYGTREQADVCAAALHPDTEETT